MLADPKDLLAIPENDFRGAMYQPLLVYRLFYRRGVDHRLFPWVTTPRPEPFSHSDVVRYLKERYQINAKREWLETWEETALAWSRPAGPTAWPYIPLTDRKATNGDIMLAIEKGCCSTYWETRFAGSSVEQGPLFGDAAGIISTTPFMRRPGGAELMRLLKPGDHIVFARIPHGLHSIRDAKAMIEGAWLSAGVVPHFADHKLDLSTPEGKMMFPIVATMIEAEADATSEQRLGVHERLRRAGRPSNGEPGLGWKFKGHGPNHRRVKDEPTRSIMQEVYRQHDQEGRSYRQISEAIEKRLCQFEGRPFKRSAFQPRRWSAQKCHRAYKAWKRILRDEYLLPVDEGTGAVAG